MKKFFNNKKSNIIRNLSCQTDFSQTKKVLNKLLLIIFLSTKGLSTTSYYWKTIKIIRVDLKVAITVV